MRVSASDRCPFARGPLLAGSTVASFFLQSSYYVDSYKLKVAIPTLIVGVYCAYLSATQWLLFLLLYIFFLNQENNLWPSFYAFVGTLLYIFLLTIHE
jgi:hypothetical protein